MPCVAEEALAVRLINGGLGSLRDNPGRDASKVRVGYIDAVSEGEV